MFCARTLFRRYRRRLVPFSCFARPDSFSSVRRASSPFSMFFAPGLLFGGTVGVRSFFHVFAPGLVFDGSGGVVSRFLVLRARTSFRRIRGRRVPFSCFALPDTFSAVSRASGPVFTFCPPRLVFGCTGGVGCRFHVLRTRNRFRRFRGRRVQFSCFALLDTFSAVPRASGLVFVFCAPELIFGGSEGVGSRFHVLFALPDSFLEVPRASGPFSMFFAR
jgi:hypothetical protein